MVFSQHDLAWMDDILPEKDKKKDEEKKKREKKPEGGEDSEDEVRDTKGRCEKGFSHLPLPPSSSGICLLLSLCEVSRVPCCSTWLGAICSACLMLQHHSPLGAVWPDLLSDPLLLFPIQHPDNCQISAQLYFCMAIWEYAGMWAL